MGDIGLPEIDWEPRNSQTSKKRRDLREVPADEESKGQRDHRERIRDEGDADSRHRQSGGEKRLDLESRSRRSEQDASEEQPPLSSAFIPRYERLRRRDTGRP